MTNHSFLFSVDCFVLQIKLFNLSVKRTFRNTYFICSSFSSAFVSFQCFFDQFNFFGFQTQRFLIFNGFSNQIISVVFVLRFLWMIAYRRSMFAQRKCSAGCLMWFFVLSVNSLNQRFVGFLYLT